ncbi:MULTISPECIES: class I SAM-dependent methyltransferase [unclassified Bradyrhizobium]|uniref:class I SAM-dependent methyltransferase n=1 Tax=unclassified Bradyrhizobium TaxID=2631580 RepID=UPI00040CFEE0|nr:MULTISPECIES: class I SAM-dependent methyltransferase [unclassified Bradyrhizobium]QIG98757.1 methyltransferase domain-containing protein [Bradyrhizobium sp. 6(2017)]
MATTGQIDRPEIRFHDEISSGWEALHQSRTFRARTAAMFDLLGNADLAGQHWLDAGCGTGTLSRLLAARGCDVTGVDASSEMVAAARGRSADDTPAGPLSFQQIPTIASLPFADRSFDGVLCASVLEYVPDVAQCLAQIHRVLRPGGLLLVSIPNRGSLLRQSYKLAHAASSRLSARPLFRYLAFSKFDASPAAMQDLLRQHGLTMLRTSFAGSPLPPALDRRPTLGTLINILARRDD